MKRKILLLPMILFLCFMFLMTALFIATPKSDYSSSEKRYLEKFPEVSVKSVTNGEFESGFENYLADHFPFRNLWVGFNSYYNYYIGNNGNDGVYKCKNDYLINVPVSKDNRVQTNIDAVANFSKGVDVPVTVMLAPSTGYIMSGVLPAVHDDYADDNMFSDVIDTLGKTDVKFVDLRETFKEEVSKGNQLYYRTDHHWTTYGAYTAYNKLCKSLGVETVEKSQFDIKTYGDFYGTTYSTSGFWLTKPDDIQVWQNKLQNKKDISLTIIEGDEQKKYHSMYFLDHLKEDDKYPVFLDGNHAVEVIENSSVESGKILIIKDSFCHSLAPFLADNYNTVTLVDMRYYKNSISNMVEEEGYDQIVVLYGIDNFATDTDLVWLK